MRAHPLAEVRWYADEMLRELRTVIPAFLRRVDVPARGGAWSAYLAETRVAAHATAGRLLAGVSPEGRGEGTPTGFDPDGELKGGADRESVVEGKRVDLGGRRII